ncbi:MAG: uroporphyrinogen decarboxylase family protein [Planctomycetota bacterium]|jgi:uroporphyrinogen decarboxylase
MAFDKDPVAPRPEVTSRNYRTMTYQETDRVPDIEFNYWGQTLQRWVGEGMDVGVDYEDPEFYGKVIEYFGYDDDLGHHHIGVRTEMNPYFEEEEIERKERSVICRSATGVIAEHFNEASGASSIPHYLEFPVKTPADWADMKRRFDPADPNRARPAEEIDALRQACDDNQMIFIFINGPYGALREWMGFENLSCAFYEYPDMVHDMVATWTDLLVSQIETIPQDLFVDEAMIWEDMACRNGPFVGPDMFREFIQPCYHAFMTALKKRGLPLAIVDCDGYPHDILLHWLEEGVNVMFPLERRQARVDHRRQRHRHGNRSPEAPARPRRLHPPPRPPRPPRHQPQGLSVLPRKETQVDREDLGAWPPNPLHPLNPF